MSSSVIKPYPIQAIAAELPIDNLLAKALLASLAEYRQQLTGRRIWLACSGGRDSLALAALCLQLYRQGQLPFLPQLLHVDHGLQADSRSWAQHVAQWAAVQGLSCQVLAVQVQGSDEQAARQARYQAMLSYINQQDVLLLAHHADDQAETVLMRLIQGSGVKGLSGMQPWRVQSQDQCQGQGQSRQHVLWRPWLSVRRATISAYAARLQLPYIDDPTNSSGANVRSSLRCDILPALAAHNPNVIENIARSAQLLADAQALVSAQAQVDMQQSVIEQLDYPVVQRVLDIDQLQKLPLYRQRQLLHYWLTQDEPLPPSKQLIDEVLSLIQRQDNNHQTQLYWQAQKQAYHIRRYRQQLYRLSDRWLNWLTLAIPEQTLSLSQIKKLDASSVAIALRTANGYCWQLELTLTPLMLMALMDDKNSLALKSAPLGRQQRLATMLATRPQAGKKLYQTLGIPVWLRDSLVVISMVLADSELPLLLCSPFGSWVLKLDSSIATIETNILTAAISSRLQINA